MGRDYDEWFAGQSFWHENTARERMDAIKEMAAINSLDLEVVLDIVDAAFRIMRHEYGD